jgi:small conductance mechanosensitive channel
LTARTPKKAMMMLSLLIPVLIVRAVFAMTLLAQVETPTGPSTTVSIPTSQPTSQPVQVIVQTAAASGKETLVDAFAKSTVGRVFTGEKALTLDDVKNPIFWFDTAKDLTITVLAFIPRFIGTMIFLFVFWLIYRGIRKMIVSSMKKSEVDSSIRDLLAQLVKWCVMGFGIVIACNQLGIPIVAMLTGVSIIGLAVGFAAQETLANFIAGIVIFLDKPFKVGDWIEIDSTFGQVRRVTFRSTRILDLDGEVIVLPNTYMLSNKVSNHSTHPLNRVNIPIGISYRASIDKARGVLIKLTEGDNRIAKNPPPEVVVDACADSSVNLLLRFWIMDEAVERRIGYEYIERAKKAFDENGIDIPFPHVQLLVEETSAIEKLAGARTAA